MDELARIDAGFLERLASRARLGRIAVEHPGANLQHLRRAVGEIGRHPKLPDEQHDAPVGVVEQHRRGEAVAIDFVIDLETVSFSVAAPPPGFASAAKRPLNSTRSSRRVT